MLPIFIVSENGHFRASAPLGTNMFSVERPSRDAAIAAVRAQIDDMSRRGEIVWVQPVKPFDSVTAPNASEEGFAEHMREIVKEIYLERDAEKAAEQSE